MTRTIFPAHLAVRAFAPVALAAVVLAACGSSAASPSSSIVVTPRIVVTSIKGDSKSALLAAMYVRVLQDAGLRVSTKDPVELDRAGYYQALQHGDFQLIPDFTADLEKFLYSQPGAPTPPTTVRPSGTATTVAPATLPPTTTSATPTGDTGASNTTPSTTTPSTTTPSASTTVAGSTTTTPVKAINNGRSVAEQITAIKAALSTGIAIGNGSAAENKQVIACTTSAIKSTQAAQLVTLTDLAGLAPGITLGGSAAFFADREFGYPAFTSFYGGTFKSTVTVEDAGLADAFAKGTIGCAAMNSMNPLITTQQLTVLDDDKVMVPSNAAIALMSSTVAEGQVIAALDTLNASLTTARLNQMVNEVDTNHTDPIVVANAFMNTL
jgi:glycine betaine/choline ABC-type transport system substrate-binding protein